MADDSQLSRTPELHHFMLDGTPVDNVEPLKENITPALEEDIQVDMCAHTPSTLTAEDEMKSVTATATVTVTEAATASAEAKVVGTSKEATATAAAITEAAVTKEGAVALKRKMPPGEGNSNWFGMFKRMFKKDGNANKEDQQKKGKDVENAE